VARGIAIAEADDNPGKTAERRIDVRLVPYGAEVAEALAAGPRLRVCLRHRRQKAASQHAHQGGFGDACVQGLAHGTLRRRRCIARMSAMLSCRIDSGRVYRNANDMPSARSANADARIRRQVAVSEG
jgi:hypothetical protein